MTNETTQNEKLKLIVQFFVNRKDVYAIQQRDGTYRTSKDLLTEKVLQNHLTGKPTIGAYQLLQDTWKRCEF